MCVTLNEDQGKKLKKDTWCIFMTKAVALSNNIAIAFTGYWDMAGDTHSTTTTTTTTTTTATTTTTIAGT